MPCDEGVAERIREIFIDYSNVVEKKMFGGLAFMLSGHMCYGVVKDTLMARVGADQYLDAPQKPYTREMDFTGKSLKGFVYVEPEGFESDEELEYWARLCERFVSTLPAK